MAKYTILFFLLITTQAAAQSGVLERYVQTDATRRDIERLHAVARAAVAEPQESGP